MGPFFIIKVYYLYWLDKAGLYSPKSVKTIPVNGPFIPLSNFK